MSGHVVEWTATYISDNLEHPVEVRLHSTTKPRKHRVFRVAGGRGRAKFTAREIHRITPTNTKEQYTMARKTKNTAVDDELEELEAALDDDDLEDLELDDDEDDDEEVEEVKPKRSKKAAAATKTKADRAKERRAARKAAEADDDEDEEDDEPEEKPARKSKKTAGKTTAKKGAAKKGKGQPNQLVRELPAGKLGAAEIAELAGVDARSVRVFLRKNEDKFPKNAELGRYAFTKKQAQQIAKAVKSA